MKTVFGLIFFQDRESISRLLPTLPNDIHLIAIDGRAPGNPQTLRWDGKAVYGELGQLLIR